MWAKLKKSEKPSTSTTPLEVKVTVLAMYPTGTCLRLVGHGTRGHNAGYVSNRYVFTAGRSQHSRSRSQCWLCIQQVRVYGW